MSTSHPLGGGSTDTGDPSQSPTTEHRRGRRWVRVTVGIAAALALIAGLAVGGLWLVASNLAGNVTTISELELPEAPGSYEPINFLVIGSDYRGDGNTVEGVTDIEGERSDTTMLVHIAQGRDRALAVSIPRDTLLELPECASESGKWRTTQKFNAAFFYGGASCTKETVEELTGVEIHHVVIVDFLGFKHIVDALGGVEVCLEEAVFDPDSGLDLPAGTSLVTGDQALAFVRARKMLGDGSDVSRIERQQQFLASAVRKVTDTQMLFKPITLYRVLDAATQSLTVDEGLNSAREMALLATSLRNLDPSDVAFVTMPFTYNSDGSSVSVNHKVADEIWAAIRADEPWPPAPEPGTVPLTVDPSEIRVSVLNGAGRDNLATDTAEELRGMGFRIAAIDLADASDYPASVVVHHPDDAEAARTLAAAVPGSELRADPGQARGQLRLVLGANFTAVAPVEVIRQPSGTADDPAPMTADQQICAS